jgi:cyanophycin synthetase
LDGNEIFILEGPQKTFVANLANVPLAENGRAMFMVENVLAACVAAYTGEIGLDAIRQALKTFVPGYELTPGRMNLFDMGDYKVLVDYAHNPHGLKAIRDYLAGVGAVRKIGVISGIGDRRDEDITEFAEIAAGMFDHIVVRQEHSLRGRTEEEINALVAKGIGKVRNDIPVDFVPDEADAARHALSIAAKGDFVVALSDQYGQVIAVIKEALHKDRPVTKLETHYEKSIAS